MAENTEHREDQTDSTNEPYDYTQVKNPARIAIYDDFKSAPRIIQIDPTDTAQFIENLASTIYEKARMMGGKISYTAIREVSENFIHAQFSEVVVSIFDSGNTIRFADQGPGIPDKEKVQKPGYTSAIEPMKRYIRGVGSGFPLVIDYLDSSHGNITIDDNLGKGATVTISLVGEKPEKNDVLDTVSGLSDQGRQIMALFQLKDTLGVTDIAKATGMSPSTVSYQLDKLEKLELVKRTASKKRQVTDLGLSVVEYLS
jgi:DNA-binding transcriptional ArsR family regulator